MADVVDRKTRSRMMAGISTKNTKPELVVRRLLHRMGFRFRLHHKDLPGKPDLVLPSYDVAVLVNGCFWHGHECHLFKWPKTNTQFWKKKINGNQLNRQTIQISRWSNGLIGNTSCFVRLSGSSFKQDSTKAFKTLTISCLFH